MNIILESGSKKERKRVLQLLSKYFVHCFYLSIISEGGGGFTNLNEIIPLILGGEFLLTIKISCKYASVRCGEVSGSNMEKTPCQGKCHAHKFSLKIL